MVFSVILSSINPHFTCSRVHEVRANQQTRVHCAQLIFFEITLAVTCWTSGIDQKVNFIRWSKNNRVINGHPFSSVEIMGYFPEYFGLRVDIVRTQRRLEKKKQSKKNFEPKLLLHDSRTNGVDIARSDVYKLRITTYYFSTGLMVTSYNKFRSPTRFEQNRNVSSLRMENRTRIILYVTYVWIWTV